MTAHADETLIRDLIASWVTCHGPTKYGMDADSTVAALAGEALSADILTCINDLKGGSAVVYCRQADWDSEMLGERVGRLSFLSSSPGPPRDGKGDLVSRFLQAAQSQFDLLIGRIDSRDVPGLNALEDAGFRVMDSLCTLVTERIVGQSCPSVRLFLPGDGPFLDGIASNSFRDDHYHADAKLSSERCDNLYVHWVRNSCAGRAAAVFVADVDGEPSGFISCLVGSEGKTLRRSGTIDLVAVAPHMRGRGLGRSLVSTALSWFHAQGVGHVQVGTQISNSPAMRLYQSLGFQVFRFVYTVHGWPNAQHA